MFPLCVVFEWDRVCVLGEVVFSSPVFSNFATTVPLLAPVPVGHASLSTAIVSTNGEDAMVLLMFLTGTVRVLFAALVGCFVHVGDLFPCADLGVRGRLFWQPNQATFFTLAWLGCYKDAAKHVLLETQRIQGSTVKTS